MGRPRKIPQIDINELSSTNGKSENSTPLVAQPTQEAPKAEPTNPRFLGRQRATGQVTQNVPLINRNSRSTGIPINELTQKNSLAGKFENLTCTDAEYKAESHIKSDLPKYRSAYEIVGFKQHDYRVSDPVVYQASLREMNLADLQEHACANGFLPSDNRDRLIERLMGKFRDETAGSRLLSSKIDQFKDMDPAQLKIVKDIISRGA